MEKIERRETGTLYGNTSEESVYMPCLGRCLVAELFALAQIAIAKLKAYLPKILLPFCIAVSAFFYTSCGKSDEDLEETQLTKNEDTSSGDSDQSDGDNDSEEEAPYINFSPSNISVPVEGGSFEVTAESNVEYTIAISETWITQTQSTDASVLNFVATANENSGTREATISLEYGDLSNEIIVTQEGPYITLSQSSAEVTVGGGTINIDVSSNVDYAVEISDDWVTLSTSSSSSSLSFVVAENGSTSARTAAIRLLWGSLSAVVNVSQECGTIEVSQEAFSLSAEGGTFKLTVTSNVEYNTYIDADWIELTYFSSNSSTDTMVFTASSNDSSVARSAVISFSWMNAFAYDVMVTQSTGSNTENGGIDDITVEDW